MRREWESLLSLSNPLNRVFASPTLYEHESRVNPKPENQVAVIRDGAGRIVGICPIMFWRLKIPFQIRRRILGNIALNAATILSGEPLAPANPEIYRRLFDGLLIHLPWCDCVYINSIPADSFTSRFLEENYSRTGGHFVYPRRLENRLFLYAELGNSYDELLRTKQSKTRNQLKRRVRKLKEYGQGLLECCRIETPDKIDEFYPAALAIDRQSWQAESLGQPLEETPLYRESLMSSAQIGCLRAYLLKCGGQPCTS